MTSRYALGDDGAACVLPKVCHLGSGIGLLISLGKGHGVELTYRVVPLQDNARVLPGNGRTCLHLCPRNLGVFTRTLAALGDKVVNAAFSILVARVPILNGGVLDLRVVGRNQLHHGSMKLVFITHWCATPLKVAYIATFIGND